MKQLTLGVGLITYNGMKYLPEQLDSILSQSRPVDHIVVSDDGSTDGTWEFLEAWAKQSPVRITLIRNQRQLGLTRNFEQAVAAVEADIIFSSDQDDVWFPDKVLSLAAIFEQNHDTMLVHTDAILVDARGQDLGTRLLEELNLSRTERTAISSGNAFDVYCCRNVVTGATASFRKSLLELAQPIPAGPYHDAWLALMAAAIGNVRLLDIPMIAYRQHGANLVGVKKLSIKEQLQRFWWDLHGKSSLKTTVESDVRLRTILLERLAAYPGVAPFCLESASHALEFAESRANLPHNPLRRSLEVLKLACTGRYRRFSYLPWSNALRDLFNR